MSDLNDLIGGEPQKGKTEFSGETELTTDVVKCKSCGANMIFDPTIQKLRCEHCGTEIDFSKNQNISEQDFNLRSCSYEDWSSETVVIRCNNCGSREVISKTDIAKVCPFCGTSNIITLDELPGIKPTAVFPFTVSKEQCAAKVRKTLGKWYVPKDCKKRTTLDDINGVYCPCWTFDSNTVSNYSGVLGRYVTRTVGSGKNRRTVTEIRYFNVRGMIDKFFDDIMIEASPQIDEKTFRKLQPFNRSCAALYDKKFLSGFVANHYDKDIETSFKEAKQIMENEIKNCILRKHNASVVQSLNINTYHNDIKFKYLLLPVWVGNFDYKKVKYHYFVNGNTARFAGKIPKSIGKICTAIFVPLGAILIGLGIYNYVTTGFIIPPLQKKGQVDFPQTIEYRMEQQEENTYELPGYQFIYERN